MNLYEIKYYTHVDYFSPIVQYVQQLILSNEQISIKQSWENGYHISIFGLMDPLQAEEIKNDLGMIQAKHPSPEYDLNEFRSRYSKIAKLTSIEKPLEEIYHNEIKVNINNELNNFQNREQLSLYLYIHHVFDQYFSDRYFKTNEIMDVMIQMYPFIDYLPETTLNETPLLVSSGYISHLSHYIGLVYSLKQYEREKLKNRFEDRIQRDLEIFYLNKSTGSTGLLNALISVYLMVSNYVDAGYLNFFSPKQYEKDIVPKLGDYNERHVIAFQNKECVDKMVNDYVLCTNRWVLNVLYEKLVLLNIKPIEKFYMNYFFSCLKFEKSVLEVKA